MRGEEQGAEPPAGTRFFTVEEARRTLPLVRRIVKDIVEHYPPLQARLQQLHLLLTDAGDGDAPHLQALRREVDRDAEEINGFLAELKEIGCLFKGFEEGLVDFYARYEGRPIHLCWRRGEEDIAWWHEVDGGFAGRRPLTPDVAAAVGAEAGD